MKYPKEEGSTHLIGKCLNRGNSGHCRDSEPCSKLSNWMAQVLGGDVARIFLSYSSTDKEIARRICNDMRGQGVEVWLDDDEIRVGDDIRRAIERGLRGYDFFVILLSAAAVNSPWVQAELSTAFEYRLAAERAGGLRATPSIVSVTEVDGHRE